jgi:transcriptional regulator with XRE-family HTH domain
MAIGESPAGARRRVRLAIREAREALGYTQAHLADAMDWSNSKMMRIESGEVTISPNDLRPLLAYLKIVDDARVQALIEDARTSRRRAMWWDEPKFREYLTPATRQVAQYEAEATEVRYFHNLVAGPLQVENYSRALLNNFHDMSGAEIDAKVEWRARRRADLLARSASVQLYVLLDEVTLRRRGVPSEIFVEQFTDLLHQAEQGIFHIQVLHFEADVPTHTFGAFDLFDLPGDHANAILYRESGLQDELIDDPSEVNRHRDMFDLRWNAALDEAQSRAMIAKTIETLGGSAPPATTSRRNARRKPRRSG